MNVNGESVHSDLCWDNELGEWHREFLHEALDEWLNKANGTGRFCVGNFDETENEDI